MECCFCQKEIEPLLDHNFEVVKLPNGKPAWDKGYSAEPLVENGRCCMHCNDHRVLPARIRNSFAKQILTGALPPITKAKRETKCQKIHLEKLETSLNHTPYIKMIRVGNGEYLKPTSIRTLKRKIHMLDGLLPPHRLLCLTASLSMEILIVKTY